MLNIKGIEASFVIAYTGTSTVAVSSRSKGSVNVQVIMEQMNGGGHFSAAALSRENAKVADIEAELKATIDQYLAEQEEQEHEGHTTE